jgi:outer membrane protein assembly factor BamE (lipoprotein component of BamABCDE complex)
MLVRRRNHRRKNKKRSIGVNKTGVAVIKFKEARKGAGGKMSLVKSYLVQMILSIVVLFITGCATVPTASRISKVSVGMTKNDVIKVMGNPASTSAEGNSESLYYALAETDEDVRLGWKRPYYVKLVDGKVSSYGRTNNSDSQTQPPADNTKTTSNQPDSLYTQMMELKKLKEYGLISEQEFEALKKKLLENYTNQVGK